jgi:hypothetical protein
VEYNNPVKSYEDTTSKGKTKPRRIGGIMDTAAERELNQAAYRQLKDTIAKTYPKGRFVAIAGGQVVADAGGFRELHDLLKERGYHSPEVLVVEAGVDYPEFMWILVQDLWS